MTTLEKLEELIYVGFKETDRKWQETDRKWQETIHQLNQLSKDTDRKIGAISNKWGTFVENLVAPAALKLFDERGIRVTRLARNLKARQDDEGLEVDILAANGEYVVLIEVKSTLGVADVNDHLDRLTKFPAFFPEYADRKIVGAVAGIEIVEDADKFAYRQGLFVIAQSGETVTILNDEKFKPKVWTRP